MKLSCNLDLLKAKVELLRRLSSEKVIYLVAQKQRRQQTLTIFTWKVIGDITAQFTIDCQVEEAGKVCLNLAVLRSFFDSDATSIELAIQGDSLLISSGEQELELTDLSRGLSLKQRVQQSKRLRLPRLLLIEGIQQCLKFTKAKSFVAQDPLECLKWRTTSDGELEFISTDGHRVCFYQNRPANYEGVIDSDLEELPHLNLTVPREVNQQLLKLLKAMSDEALCEVNFGWNEVEFIIGSYYLKANLNTTSFPPVEQVVPVRFERSLTVNRQKLVRALRFLKEFCQSSVVLRVDGAANKLTLVSVSKDGNQAQQSMWASALGEDIEIAFNHKYLTEAIAVLSSEEVVFKLNQANQVAAIVPRAAAATTRTYLMPVKIETALAADSQADEEVEEMTKEVVTVVEPEPDIEVQAA